MPKEKEKNPKEKTKKRRKEPPEEFPTIKGAMGRLGLHRKTRSTLILAAAMETKASPEEVWEVWSEIEKWPTWQKPLVTSARWIDTHEWVSGAKFDIKMTWGGALGKVAATETVKEVDKPISATWTTRHKGPEIFGKHPISNLSCTIWFFDPLPAGGTKIIFTCVMVGFKPWLAKCFGARRKWTAGFKTIVENLVKTVDRASQIRQAPSASEAQPS